MTVMLLWENHNLQQSNHCNKHIVIKNQYSEFIYNTVAIYSPRVCTSVCVCMCVCARTNVFCLCTVQSSCVCMSPFPHEKTMVISLLSLQLNHCVPLEILLLLGLWNSVKHTLITTKNAEQSRFLKMLFFLYCIFKSCVCLSTTHWCLEDEQRRRQG